MKLLSKVVLFLGLVSITAICPIGQPEAAAQPTDAMFSMPGFLEIVSAGEVVGDGENSVKLHVLALNPDGSAMTGLKLRANASGGTTTAPEEVGGGLYTFDYQPESVTTPTTAQISVRGRTADRSNIEATYNLPVRPPLSRGLSAKANPARIVLGQDKDATISFTLEGAVGTLSARDLQVSLSSGELTNLTHLGQGRFTARFVAPKVNYPQLSIMTVADRRNPSKVFSHITIPLVGKTDYPVRAEPGSTVILRIAGQEFGPVQADETGRAKVPVLVPPGVQFATKVQVHNGVSTDDKIDLRVPETKRVQMFPLQKGLPGDGSTKIPVRALVLTSEGKLDTQAGVTFTATGGTISPAVHEGNGVYRADFTPKFGNSQIPGSIRVSLRGSSIQGDEAKFTLVPARPESIKLKAEPSRLSKDATSLRVFAKVLGPNGIGMPQRNLSFSMNGASSRGSVQDLRNGDYRADFTTIGKTHVDAIALVSSKTTGNPLRHIFLFPTRDLIPNDALSTTPIVIVTTDEFGAPVPNVDVKLQLESGDGSIPVSAVTSANGVATALYTSGRRASLIRVRASAKNQTGSGSFIQGPAGMVAPDLSVSGSAATTALLRSWKKSVSVLRIEREGASEVANAVDIGTGQAGAVASLEVTPSPATVAPGGKVKLTLKAVDGQGRGVAGKSFEMMCSAGMFGGLNDLGGGTYETTLSVPPGASGEIKVSMASSDGSVTSFLKIPVSGEAVAGSGTTGWGDSGGDGKSNFDGGAFEGGDPKKVKKPKKPSTTEGPWIRMGAGFVASSYQYKQRSLNADGPLLPVTLLVGGKDGDKNATPMGGTVALKGWLDPVNLPYVGFDVAARFSAWSLTADEFNGQVAPDTLFSVRAELAGRYPMEFGGTKVYAAGKIGMMFNDFIYFTGSFDEGQVRYETLMVPSLRTGVELGLESGGVFGHVGLGYAWAYLQTPYQLETNVKVGYQLTDMIFADVGFDWYQRSLVVKGVNSGLDVGELSDSQMVVSVGVGASF